MKLGIFADPHYSSAALTCGRRHNRDSLEKIRKAYARFEAEACDLIVCMGDLTDSEPTHEAERANLERIAQLIHSCPIPTFCILGNHDGFAFPREEFYGILGQACRPRTVCAAGATLLFLDACYYADGTPYGPGGTRWEDTFVPDLSGLQRQLDQAQGDVYLFVHQNLDPHIHPTHVIGNASDIRAMLEAKGTVRTVYQGHYHPGLESVHHGIRYQTFPAMCEAEDGFFLETI